MSSEVDIQLPLAAGSGFQGDLTEADKEHLTYLRTVQTITPARRQREDSSKERAKLISTTAYNLKARQELQAQLKKEKDRAKAEHSDGSQNSQEDAAKVGKKTMAEMMKKKGSQRKK